MSKSIRVLCYTDRSHLLNRVIDDYSWAVRWTYRNEARAYSELRCSHSEIYFPDTNECYTSTMRDKVNGIVIRPASEVLTHPKRWYYFEIELTDEEYKAMYEYALFQAILMIRYSKLTIASFFWPWRINQKGADICSEAVNRAIVHGLQMPSHSNLLAALRKIEVPSPLRLASNIFKCGYPLHSLETGKIILENKV